MRETLRGFPDEDLRRECSRLLRASVVASYLTAFSKQKSDVERAKVCLGQLIDLYGAGQMRSILANAATYQRAARGPSAEAVLRSL